MDIVDQRLQRLENRAAMLEDVEALLEAERVALELERRDMYTARCRQWFGDGTS
jgi:SWI/SNF related-matrix-associated actin-dependent regulator of chromatin subfamily C